MHKRSDYINTDTPLKSDLLNYFSKSEKLIIFDVGGCEGEDSIRYSRLFPNSEIFIFEPLPNNQNLINENINKYNSKNITLVKKALSDKISNEQFFVSSGSPSLAKEDMDWDFGNKSSSLLAPGNVFDFVPWLKFNEVIEVSATTIQDFATSNRIVGIDFMHLDVQGAELKVLNGASSFIDNIKIIWLEVSSEELYEGQPLKNDIEKFMCSKNFILIKSVIDGISGDQLYINKKYFSYLNNSGLNYLSTYVKNLIPKTVKVKVNEFKSLMAKKSEKNKYGKISFSQSGEDLIIDFLFNAIGITYPTYIDIGAHHPFYLNNTAIFYQRGCRGINVEPDPNLFPLFEKYRSFDKNLNLGVSDETGLLDFYIINVPTLNTFSKSDALTYSLEGNYFITEVKQINVDTFNNILELYFDRKVPDLLTIDAEGVDEIILKSINFETSPPIIICIETISFSSVGKGVKNKKIIDFLVEKGYLLYADTNINSIFILREKWERNN